MRHVDDTGVVGLIVGLEEWYEHSVLTAFLAAVVVELLKEVLVLVTIGSGVALVLHLEHDGDVLEVIVLVAEDEVTLATLRGIIVLLEIGIGQERANGGIELGAAMLLQSFAHHFCWQTSLQVLIIINQSLLLLELHVIHLLKGNHASLSLTLLWGHLVLQLSNFLLLLLEFILRLILLLKHCHTDFRLAFGKSCLQLGYLGIPGSQLLGKLQLLGLEALLGLQFISLLLNGLTLFKLLQTTV